MGSDREAVIFAGGKSSRMGEDKALLPFGGYATLAEYQYRRLLPLFDRVSLSTKGDKFAFDAPQIYDQETQTSSPMVALASVLKQISGEWVFVLSVDMPCVDGALIERLYRARSSHPDARIILASSSQGWEPLCGLYHREVLHSITAMLSRDHHRMQTLLEGEHVAEVACPRSEVFANLNTPDAYAYWYDRTCQDRGLLPRQ